MVIPGRHALSGSSMMVVSNIDSGAGSVAVLARPALPNTVFTSGKAARIESCLRSASSAVCTLMPGNVVGMYRREPSSRGGMNSDPMRWAGSSARITAAMVAPTTGQRNLNAHCRIGVYTRMRNRCSGFRSSERKRPRTK